ncbi:hypothetical protein GIB67_013512 [Kingdonia uniflora]|uniref:Uncharacterized protein n=1 Tax=Kingdonia uniflora TaxID=39325 RepID=A0A7J7KUT6_9MAGN|nr:hypothetical protein GIB67_013512 [Kingdonia uniflora]
MPTSTSEPIYGFVHETYVCNKALKEEYLRDASQAEGFVNETEKVHLKQLDYLKDVLNKAAEVDILTEVSLNSYFYLPPPRIELKKLKGWKVGSITHAPVSKHQLVPNFSIKELVQAFLKENGWA